MICYFRLICFTQLLHNLVNFSTGPVIVEDHVALFPCGCKFSEFSSAIDLQFYTTVVRITSNYCDHLKNVKTYTGLMHEPSWRMIQVLLRRGGGRGKSTADIIDSQ